MRTEHFSDENLDFTLGQKIKNEREILIDILYLLREAELRRLFSKYGYQSLLEYACKRHGYSEDQANRRISAMRLLKEIPEIEEKIESGALTLTHLCKAQAVFRSERRAEIVRTPVQKLELLTKIEKAPTRQAEKILESEAFVVLPKKSRELSLEQFSGDVQSKLKRLMDVLAHSKNAKDVNALVGKLADLGLEKWDPIKKAERVEVRAGKADCANLRSVETELIEVVAPINNDAVVPAAPQVSVKTNNSRKYIPLALRRALFKRDNYQCTNCKSARALEIDHIIAFGKGGKTELSNLRLLCRPCNQRHAIFSYGLSKMSKYLKEPSRLYSIG